MPFGKTSYAKGRSRATRRKRNRNTARKTATATIRKQKRVKNKPIKGGGGGSKKKSETTVSAMVSRLRDLLTKHGVTLAATASTAALVGMAIVFLQKNKSVQATVVQNAPTIEETNEGNPNGAHTNEEQTSKNMRDYDEILNLVVKVYMSGAALFFTGVAFYERESIRNFILLPYLETLKSNLEAKTVAHNKDKIEIPFLLTLSFDADIIKIVEICKQINENIDHNIDLSTYIEDIGQKIYDMKHKLENSALFEFSK